jgi:hypothetical protein
MASDLDGREAAFELHANGGVSAWRNRLRSWFSSYNELANGVHGVLAVTLPRMDLNSLQHLAYAPQRPVTAPRPKAAADDAAATDVTVTDNT